jgi:general secretion pathway protein B
MSLILDALKKLDREKKSRRRRASNITAEILRSDAPDRRKTLLIYLAVALLAAAITVTVTYSLKRDTPSLQVPPPSPAVTPSANPQVSPAPPVDPAQPVLEIENWRKEKPVVRRDRNEEEPVRRTPVRVEPRKEAGVPSRESEGRVEPNLTESASVSPVSLKLSVIAWSENPSNRVAVVNEEVLGEGAVIKGVKVVEISPTFVRFSHKGRAFEIPLGSSVSFMP